MPEVVEVCLTALYLNKKLKGKFLEKISILGGRYSRHTMKGLSHFQTNNVFPLKIIKINSKGKFMWFELIDKRLKKFYIINTFGLEGEWNFKKKLHSGIKFEIKDKKSLDKMELYFTDSRNFGTLELLTNRVKLDEKLNKLAPDFLKEPFTENQFYDRIKKYITDKKGNISSARGNKEIIKILMEQKNSMSLGSGLGNYLCVEALWRAKISPYTKIKKIFDNKKLSDRLSKSIKYTVKLSFMTSNIGYLANLEPDMEQFIDDLREKINSGLNKYNFHPEINLGNERFKFNVYRQKEDIKGNKIQNDKIIKGRTTYWSPKVQK